jgi:hypothetical protein
MLTITEMVAENLGSHLAERMGRRFGSTDAGLVELVGSAAKLAMECIGDSDALNHAERLIGSIRRECPDHIVVTGEQHLRHILTCYLEYYNAMRTHLSLGKDAPNGRAIQRHGRIEGQPMLGGLHHQYVRI